MKRIGNLFGHAFSVDNLHAAFLDARRGKRGTMACFAFERRLGAQLKDLKDSLNAGTYRPRPYIVFEVREPKVRTIYGPAFRDLVVQHAIYRLIRPIFDRRFIDQSYACRVGKGTHAAADYAQNALQNVPRDSLTLKLDVRKFFYRIDRCILRELIERVVKDAPLVTVMMLFADHGEPQGIPIGNLLSQLYALIYLNPLDHFIKRELGAKWYCRYVDDFVLFGLTREQAMSYRERIVAFLAGYGLTLSKWSLQPTSRGINFVGYRTWASKRFIRRRALYNFRKAVARLQYDSIQSSLGHAKRTHSHNYMTRYIAQRRST